MSALTEQAALYAAERAPECGEYVTLQRAYMADALAHWRRLCGGRCRRTLEFTARP